MTVEFHKWPKIRQFSDVYKNMKRLTTKGFERVPTVVDYVAKVKLHGTNAAIRKNPDGGFLYQKRSGFITRDNDNFDFVKTCEDKHKEEIEKVMSALSDEAIIFGEFCGPGINNGTAINNLKEHMFFIFAVYEIGQYFTHFSPLESSDLSYLIDLNPENFINIIPTQHIFQIDFSSPAYCEQILEELKEEVAEIEKQCPIGEKFGLEGAGEGLVMTPKNLPLSGNSFKVKGEKFDVSKKNGKNKQSIDPVKASKATEFAAQHVTDNRVSQIITELGGINHLTMADTGTFLKAIGNDVRDETVNELEASGMEWKDVAKEVNHRAVEMFKDRMNEIT